MKSFLGKMLDAVRFWMFRKLIGTRACIVAESVTVIPGMIFLSGPSALVKNCAFHGMRFTYDSDLARMDGCEFFLTEVAGAIRGRVEGIFTWEGGDSHTGLRIVDGEVEECDVAMTLVPKKPKKK